MSRRPEVDVALFVKRQLVFFQKYIDQRLTAGQTAPQISKGLQELAERYWAKDPGQRRAMSMPKLLVEFDWSRHQVLRELGFDAWRCFAQETDEQIFNQVCEKTIAGLRSKPRRRKIAKPKHGTSSKEAC